MARCVQTRQPRGNHAATMRQPSHRHRGDTLVTLYDPSQGARLQGLQTPKDHLLPCCVVAARAISVITGNSRTYINSTPNWPRKPLRQPSRTLARTHAAISSGPIQVA